MSELSGGVMLTENALRCVARSIEMFYKKKAQNRDWCITTVRNAADQFEKMREEISTLRAQPAACEIAEYAEDCKDCGFCAQPANEPLTIEQMREMEQRGEGIYVTHADGSPIFRGKQYTAAVLDRIAAFGAMGYHLQAIYGRGLTLAEDDCGKTWLAYDHKPGGDTNA